MTVWKVVTHGYCSVAGPGTRARWQTGSLVEDAFPMWAWPTLEAAAVYWSCQVGRPALRGLTPRIMEISTRTGDVEMTPCGVKFYRGAVVAEVPTADVRLLAQEQYQARYPGKGVPSYQ